MEKTCYAIMPYGGSEQSLKDRFNSVYQLYMLIPAMEKGFTVTREDIQAQPGSITANIVHHLAEAELVIADLSNNNWNVAYELGIRHCFVKGKTILLCDNKTDLNFDIRGFNVIRYDGDNPAADMFSIQEMVRKAIAARLKTPTKADNQVHETFSFAHDNLIDYLDNAEADIASELAQLKTEYAALSAENENLKKELQKSGQPLNLISATHESIIQKIEDAMRSLQYSGDSAVVKLRQAFAQPNPNYNEIQNILQQALTEGYMTEGNFRSMYLLFIGQGQPQLTNLILELAEQRYPESLDFKSYLAQAYANNYKTQDKAIQYADEVLQVTVVDGKRYSKCKKIDNDQLASCLNAYIHLHRYDILIEIIPQLLEQVSEHREMLLRNLVAAYREMGDTAAQVEAMKTLLEEYPMNDVNHYHVFRFLHQMNENMQAFYHLEFASALDPDDTDYLFALAGCIFDDHICRSEEYSIRKISRKEECARAAVPFLMQAIQVETSNRCLQKCKDLILRNGIGKYEEIFDQWISEGMRTFGIPDLDYNGVRYLTQLGDRLDENLCRQIYNSEMEKGLISCESEAAGEDQTV